MVYHDAIEMVVMLGGSHPSREPTNTLWGWNGEVWHILSDDGPPPRLHTGCAYDRAREKLVVYGGIKNREESFGDTWEWDGEAWTEFPPARGGPGVRDHHAMIYDPVHRTVVLWGGQDEADQNPPETWGWDGNVWRVLAEHGPPPRGTHRFVYDSDRERIILYGGWGPDGQYGG